jgi:hypothetical protein
MTHWNVGPGPFVSFGSTMASVQGSQTRICMDTRMRLIVAVIAVLLTGCIAAEDQSGSARFDIAKVRPVVRQGATCFKKGEVTSG